MCVRAGFALKTGAEIAAQDSVEEREMRKKQLQLEVEQLKFFLLSDPSGDNVTLSLEGFGGNIVFARS